MVGQGEREVIHDQTLILGDARLTVDYGVTANVAVSMMLPVRTVDTSIRYLADGAEVDLTAPNIHHRNETLSGVADPWVFARVAVVRGAWLLGARAGVTLPLGRTEEDPFALGDMGLAHQHIQFGSGIFAPLLGAEVERSFARWRLSAWVLTQQALYENAKGYHPGDRYAGGVTASSALNTKLWDFGLGLEGQGETAERWGGVTHTDDGNRGRFDLLAGASVTRRLPRDLALTASIKAPLYTHVVGGQLEYPLLATLGVTATFGGKPPPHVHSHDDDHDHGDEHGHDDHDDGPPPDTAGLDVVEVAKAGEAVDLVPVPGKLTVFDFWAEWCKPCKQLDREMTAIAHRYPGKLAIRKVNIVDWDSDAAARYMKPGAFDLPHVKIFGPDGRMIVERSGTPEDIAREVDSLLAPVPAADALRSGRIEVKVTEQGFEPAELAVRRGDRVTLAFTRTIERTCATEVIITPPGGQPRPKHELPLGKTVEVAVTLDVPGRWTFACAMNMIRGSIVVP